MSEERKAREFWIAPKLIEPNDPVEPCYFYAYDLPGDPKRLELHVIEHQAYSQAQAEIENLKKQNEIMREALLRIQVRVDEGGYEYSQAAISEIVKYGLTKES